jgi:hypothetical protein
VEMVHRDMAMWKKAFGFGFSFPFWHTIHLFGIKDGTRWILVPIKRMTINSNIPLLE